MITMRAVRQGLLPGLIVAGVLAASLLLGPYALKFHLTAVCSYGYLGAPNVTGVSPSSGSINGNLAVTITGCGFTGATGVAFGAQPANFTITNDSTIAANSPSHAAGVVDVHVTTAAGTSAANPPGDQFTYVGPCTSVTATATPATTAKAGSVINIAAVAVGCPNPLYQFFVLNPGGSWAVAQAYSPRATFNWDTGGPETAGTYYYSVWARDATSSGTSCNSLGCNDAFKPGTSFALTSNPCTSVTAVTSVASPQAQGTPVTITATAVGCTNPTYQFWLLAPGSTTWHIVQPYGPSNVFVWTTTNNNGSYYYSVWARDSSSQGLIPSSLGSPDAFKPGVIFTLT